MFSFVIRAGLLAALVAFACLTVSAHARRSTNRPKAQSARRLFSAMISPMRRSSWKRRSRPMPGQVTKPAAQLRREADAAFQRNDFRSGMQILGQIVAVAPDDSANWLRLARAVSADPPAQ